MHEMEAGRVTEREEHPTTQSAERIIELTETRKSLDSFNPPPPIPVLAPMASMEMNVLGDERPVPPVAQPPADADG
jgi:hypothetical protein